MTAPLPAFAYRTSRSWLASFKTRYVRTPAGVRRYGVPIGSPIPIGRRVRPAAGRPRRGSSSGRPPRRSNEDQPTLEQGARRRIPLTPSERDVAERHFGGDGTERGARYDPNAGDLEILNGAKAAATLRRIKDADEDGNIPPARRRAMDDLSGKITASEPAAPPDAAAPDTDDPGPAPQVRPIGEKELADDFRRRNTLSEAEEDSLSRYTTSKFAGINRKLRGQPRNNDQDGRPDEIDADIANLDAVISRYSTPGTFTGYRGMQDNDAFPPGDLTGKVITANGYSSTAVGDKPTGRFANYGTMMEITVPQGMPGIAVNGTNTGFADEREFILPHGTRFRVDSQAVREPGGGWPAQRILRVTALPPLPAPEGSTR